jgi:hypothetical protein
MFGAGAVPAPKSRDLVFDHERDGTKGAMSPEGKYKGTARIACDTGSTPQFAIITPGWPNAAHSFYWPRKRVTALFNQSTSYY